MHGPELHCLLNIGLFKRKGVDIYGPVTQVFLNYYLIFHILLHGKNTKYLYTEHGYRIESGEMSGATRYDD